jgi:hypothetical protein
LKELNQVVPEAFPDCMLNLDNLKKVMGENIEDECAPSEHIGLT